MTTEPTTSQTASVAPAEGNMKRSIQMKWFASDEQKARVNYLYTQDKDPTKAAIVLGTVVGEIFAVKRRINERPSGEPFETVMALGDFEALNYSTGEVITSPNAYLPAYFLDTVEAFFEAGAKTMDVALEIVLVPTGKSIPIAYEVRQLVARAPQSGVNRMKAALLAANRLPKGLPPPVDAPQLMLSAPAETAEPEQEIAEKSNKKHPMGDGAKAA